MLKPRNDYIVVKRDHPEKKSPGGIEFVLPADADQQPAQGVVVATGPGNRSKRGQLIPVSVKVGDRVLIGHYGGDTVKVGGDDLVMVRDGELLGVVE